jgi:MFS family permease
VTGELVDQPERTSLWRNRDYMSWWTGTAISLTGTSVSEMAFPLLVLFSTGSVAKAGLISAAERLGALATTLWGGALADRVSRKVILICGPLLQAIVMGIVAVSVLSGHISMPLLVAAALAGGMIAGVGDGATIPALRRLVPAEQFAARSAQEQGRQMVAQFIGSPLAGFLFSLARSLPFVVDAVSYVFASLGSALIRRPLGPDRLEGDERQSVMTDIREGIRFVWAQPYLRFVTVWISVINMLANGFLLLFIAVLVYRGAGPRMVGVASSLVLLGGVAGALLSGRIIERFQARKIFLVAGWAFSAALVLVAVAPSPWEASLATCFAVMVFVPLDAIREAYTVRMVPDGISGRVTAVGDFGFQSLTWIGVLLAGALASRFGTPTALLIFAALSVPLAVASHRVKALEVFQTPVAEVGEVSFQPAGFTDFGGN